MPRLRWKIHGPSPDPDATGEKRFVTLGADPKGTVLVTVYAVAGENRRIISARKASPDERKRYGKP